MSSINVKFNSRDFRATRAKNSEAMKKVLEFGSAKKALKHESQRQAFYDALKKNKDPRHMDKALKKTLGEFLGNKKDKTTDEQVNAMAKEMVRYGKRFIMAKKEVGASGSAVKRTDHPIMEKVTERRAQILANRPNLNQVQNVPPRINIAGNCGLQNKLRGVSPSFWATTHSH